MGPRFSIRTALYALTGMAFYSLVLAQAVRGNPWGVGALAATLCLIAAFLPFAAWYGIVRVFGAMLGPERPRSLATGAGASAEKEA